MPWDIGTMQTKGQFRKMTASLQVRRYQAQSEGG